MSSTQKQYVYTMVFAIVAGIASLSLLIAMFALPTDTVKRIAPGVITVEVGLIAVIIFCLRKILQRESDLDKRMADGAKDALSVTACPDYWQQQTAKDGTHTCHNTYVHPLDPKVTYTIQGSASAAGPRSIKMKDFDGKPMRDACPAAQKAAQSAWTPVTTACDSYSIPAI